MIAEIYLFFFYFASSCWLGEGTQFYLVAKTVLKPAWLRLHVEKLGLNVARRRFYQY